ncbi:fungal-specific transcription factor domain-containing protein [Aspergillus transmontanensis]|uniref:Fungal-specific transcription factor domain-containing protein n=1 Tax=Aspergillus transmontanensis TaxID=1034304 RepID=A0A5N6WB91_9EURO|nr:fungal-specific transcription factor domain-containing protein [Aspergillus transmontanensis]
MTPKPRSKTFTGCWTCRSRRVKCDEQRPNCQRCHRSGRTCQGYSVRLGWTNASGTTTQRRLLRSSTRAVPELSPCAVTTILSDLDHSSGRAIAQRGPFSVFSVSVSEDSSQNIRVRSPRESSTESSDSFLPHQHDLSPSSSPKASLMVQQLPFPEPPKCVVSEDALGGIGQTTPNLLQMERMRSFDICAAATRDKAWGCLLEKTRIPSSLNPTNMATPEIELIHHWVVFLSGNLILIDLADNPCRTVFMPLALKGLNSSPTESNMHRAVFHGLCAASAFSLYHLRGESRYQSLAVQHDQQALQHLRLNLRPGSRLDETTLVAVLTCIAAEAMSGRRSRWRAHVLGGLGMLENELDGEWLQSPTAARLLQSYLSLSSLCNFRMSAQLVALLKELPNIQNYLERSHGVSQSLVQFLADISALRKSPGQTTVAELDNLELQLYLQFPSLHSQETPESIVIQHALNSFYYATLIYFRRSLRRVPVADVQDLVEKAVHDLEAAEALTHRKGGCAYNWASFVVAAECSRPDLQERMLVLFDRKRRHGIKNIQSLGEIVTTLWQRRASAPGLDIHWEEIANEADYDIMLV